MAQKEVKDYFPSQKLQNRGKNSTRKRRVESLVVSASKKRKVLTHQPSQLTSKDNKDGDIPLRNLCTSLFSSLSSTSTTKPYEIPNPVKGETSPVGVKNSTTKLNCFETLPSTVSPLRRGAECVRLALEKKKSSVSLGKEKAPVISETRRKLFSSEVTDDPGTKIEDSTVNETPSAVAVKAESKPSDVRPAKQSISGITPLVKKSNDMTRSKEAPKLKPFTSLQYDSPTKGDKLDINTIKSL